MNRNIVHKNFSENFFNLETPPQGYPLMLTGSLAPTVMYVWDVPTASPARRSASATTGHKGVLLMSEELLEQRIAALNASDVEVQGPVQDPDRRTYSVEDIQRILDISRSTAYQLIRKKVFKSVKVGKQIRISRSSFDAWLDAS